MTSFMRQEIEEIPQATARLLERAGATLAAAGRELAGIDPAVVVTIARGSSDHVATYLKYAIELAAGVPVASVGPSVASIYGARLKLEGSAAFAISQSGASPDIVAMADAARAGGALTIALTNTAGSPLALAVSHAIDIAAGVEKSVAATKTFVASVVAGLAVLAHWTGDRALLKALDELPGQFEKALGCDWSAMTGALDGQASCFILGRGPAIAIANEVALKLKETSGLHAEAYSAAEVMHGPLALVGPGFPVLALAVDDAAQASTVEAADALAGKGGAAFVTSRRAKRATPLPHAPAGHPLTDPLALVVSFYAFVEAFARHRGFDPDQPRNLRKVTETR